FDVITVRIALPQFPGTGDDLFGEALRYALVNVNALHGGAGLTGVGEGAPGDLLRRCVQVGIRKDDGRILADQLQHAGDHLLGGGEVHLPARSDRAGEHDHVDAAADELRADVPLSLYDAEEHARVPSLLDEIARPLQDDG